MLELPDAGAGVSVLIQAVTLRSTVTEGKRKRRDVPWVTGRRDQANYLRMLVAIPKSCFYPRHLRDHVELLEV